MSRYHANKLISNNVGPQQICAKALAVHNLFLPFMRIVNDAPLTINMSRLLISAFIPAIYREPIYLSLTVDIYLQEQSVLISVASETKYVASS